MLVNRFGLIDWDFRSSGGQRKGLFVGGDGAAGDVRSRVLLERRIGVSTSPWSHQGLSVIGVSSLSVWRFFDVCAPLAYLPFSDTGGSWPKSFGSTSWWRHILRGFLNFFSGCDVCVENIWQKVTRFVG